MRAIFSTGWVFVIETQSSLCFQELSGHFLMILAAIQIECCMYIDISRGFSNVLFTKHPGQVTIEPSANGI